MVVRRVLKFRIECDGYKPNGQRCPCDTTIEDHSLVAAEARAKGYGWYEDHRGWLCNARDGHRDDRSKTGGNS